MHKFRPFMKQQWLVNVKSTKGRIASLLSDISVLNRVNICKEILEISTSTIEAHKYKKDCLYRDYEIDKKQCVVKFSYINVSG